MKPARTACIVYEGVVHLEKQGQ